MLAAHAALARRLAALAPTCSSPGEALLAAKAIALLAAPLLALAGIAAAVAVALCG